MADSYAAVKTVIEVLHDGTKGFLDIGEHLKDPLLKRYFISESQTRATFADQLEGELSTISNEDTDIGGTVAGAVHRVWGDLKAHLGGTDHTLLETAEQGEDAAKKAYQDALADGATTAGRLREILITQQQHILESHNKVKAFRDSLAS
jgi:uncharacterized protein (TIGR02284 family)